MFSAHPVKNYSIVGQSKRTFFCMMKWSTGTIKGHFSSVNTIAAHEKHTRHGTIIEEPFKLNTFRSSSFGQGRSIHITVLL